MISLVKSRIIMVKSHASPLRFSASNTAGVQWGSFNSFPRGQIGILADDIFNSILWNENDRIPIHISLKYVPRSPIDNEPALVQVMAWRLLGAKPLPEPMMTEFIDANMRH